jgi:phosphoribosylformylglycinamidine cyclo-ligase
VSITYKDAGVDIEKGDALVEKIKLKVKSTYGSRVRSGVGGFACLYEVGDRLLAAGTDGVGTKLALAKKLNKHDTIGIDLVAMCVNDILCTGAQPLFFMDYLATGELDVDTASHVLDGIVEGCLQSECALIGGETAEMPGMYGNGEYDLAGFAVGEVKPADVLDGSRVSEGDILIGLPSSGFHSNGYSLVRKLINDDETELMTAALTPTKIYWKAIKSLLEKQLLNGVSHVTGGGLLNIPRINEGFAYQIDSLAFKEQAPAFMLEITARANTTDKELFRTFNMGVGLVCIVSADKVDDVIQALQDNGEQPVRMGYVKAGSGEVYLPDGSQV